MTRWAARGRLDVRRLLVTIAVAGIAVSLAGCAPAAIPDFVPPIVWEGHTSYSPGGRAPDNVKIELAETGAARLTNFPQGRSVHDEEGFFCISDLQQDRFTGEATWEARNGFSLFVRFADSEILVSSETVPFGGQDWTEVLFASCDTEQMWNLGYECGDSGYGSGDETIPGFAEECRSEE